MNTLLAQSALPEPSQGQRLILDTAQYNIDGAGQLWWQSPLFLGAMAILLLVIVGFFTWRFIVDSKKDKHDN